MVSSIHGYRVLAAVWLLISELSRQTALQQCASRPHSCNIGYILLPVNRDERSWFSSFFFFVNGAVGLQFATEFLRGSDDLR